MSVRRRITPLVTLFYAAGISLLSACAPIGGEPLTHHELAVDRLRLRAELAERYFMAGDFARMQLLGSERYRREIESLSVSDQRRGRQDFERFVRLEQPTSAVLSIEVNGLWARVTKRVSVLRKDRTRASSVVYDHWVFERGDWFFDEVDRVE